MFTKTIRLNAWGDKNMPQKSIEYFRDNCKDYDDSLFKIKILDNNGFLRIFTPDVFEDIYSLDDFDFKIDWILDYIIDKVPIIRHFGAEKIELDIKYNLDLKNRQQRYVDNLSVDQMRKMSMLGISYEISIWANDSEEE